MFFDLIVIDICWRNFTSRHLLKESCQVGVTSSLFAAGLESHPDTNWSCEIRSWRKINSRCRPLACLAHDFNGRITKYCYNVNWGLCSKCCSMVIWSKAKKMRTSAVCAPACLKMFACPSHCFLMKQWMSKWLTLYFGHASTRWHGRGEVPVDNECDFCKCWLPVYKCVHIFSYKLCSLLPYANPILFPSNLLVVLKRQRREQERALQ